MKLTGLFAVSTLLTLSACMFNARIDSLEQSSHASVGGNYSKVAASLTSSATSYDESVGEIELTIEINEQDAEDVSVNFSIEGTTTPGGVDYTLLTPSPILIPKGSRFGKIKLQITNDGIGDAGESIVVKIKENEKVSLSANSDWTIFLTETLPPLVVSSSKLASNSSLSYVDIDVDWGRGLAYLASRKTGVCINVVDFNNTLAPTIVKTVGSGTLQTCLGVKLFDSNKKVLLSSNGSNKLAAWDLTVNPIDYLSWYSLGEYAIGSGGKRIAKIEQTGGSSWTIYSTKSAGVIKANLAVSGATGTFSLINSYTTAISFNAATVLGNTVLAQSFTGSVQPVNFLNLSLAATSTATTSFWGWAAVTNSAGTKAFLGGGPGGAAFFADELSVVSLKKKLLLNSTCTVRGADFAYQGTTEYLYMICANGFINVFDVTDISNPVLTHVGQISPIEIEAYGIKVKPNSNLALAITNSGDFIVLNLQGLSSASTQYPVDP